MAKAKVKYTLNGKSFEFNINDDAAMSAANMTEAFKEFARSMPSFQWAADQTMSGNRAGRPGGSGNAASTGGVGYEWTDAGAARAALWGRFRARLLALGQDKIMAIRVERICTKFKEHTPADYPDPAQAGITIALRLAERGAFNHITWERALRNWLHLKTAHNDGFSRKNVKLTP